MSDVEVESLLSPIGAESPCGSDLEYDDAFRELFEAGEDKPEAEYGDKVYPARPPDWPTVREKAAALAARTHDLRVVVWMARSGARLSGVESFVDALRVIHGLLERYWPTVHPLLDASDQDDPTTRLNALTPLASAQAGLADLRVASLTGRRGGLSVRDVELAFRAAEPIGSEAVPSEEGIVQAIKSEDAAKPGLIATLAAGAETLTAITAVLAQHVPTASLPDFDPLHKTLTALSRAAARARGAAVEPVVEGRPSAPESVVAGISRGPMQTREDAIAMLDQVCAWLERNDPSNPAPLLIRRAQRLMQKNFMDIIRDLAPDTLEQIEKLAGISQS